MNELTFNIFCTKLGEALIGFGIFFAFLHTIKWPWKLYKKRKDSVSAFEELASGDELEDLLKACILSDKMFIAKVLTPILGKANYIFVKVIKGNSSINNKYFYVSRAYEDEIIKYKGIEILIRPTYGLGSEVESDYLEFLRQKENKRLKVIKKEKNND